eukprot:jgi/Antlo1/438/1768
MLPLEFIESMTCLYRAFGLISKIMLSIYNELDLDESIDREMLKLKKAITGRCGQLRIKKRRKASVNLNEYQLFIKRNIRKYRKKHYDLAYKDVFKALVKEWKEKDESKHGSQSF